MNLFKNVKEALPSAQLSFPCFAGRSIILWWFKPFLSVGLWIHSYLSGSLRYRNYCSFGLEEKKKEKGGGLWLRKNKLWKLVECVTPYNRPSCCTLIKVIHLTSDIMLAFCINTYVAALHKSL